MNKCVADKCDNDGVYQTRFGRMCYEHWSILNDREQAQSRQLAQSQDSDKKKHDAATGQLDMLWGTE